MRRTHGRPFVGGHPEVQVSLSHTRGAVIAAASGGPVGADIESLGLLLFELSLLERELTPAECAAIGRSADQHVAFLRHWTRKEALKAGLGEPGRPGEIDLGYLAMSGSHDRAPVRVRLEPGRGCCSWIAWIRPAGSRSRSSPAGAAVRRVRSSRGRGRWLTGTRPAGPDSMVGGELIQRLPLQRTVEDQAVALVVIDHGAALVCVVVRAPDDRPARFLDRLSRAVDIGGLGCRRRPFLAAGDRRRSPAQP